MTEISTQTLDDAITSWQKMVALDHPLFDLPVEKANSAPQNGGKQLKGNSLWMFATDTHKVMAHLYKPGEIDSAFDDVVAKLYETAYGRGIAPPPAGLLSALLGENGPSEEFKKMLSYHNSLSLLIHELFHNLYCPDSEDDKKKIYQAIAAGIKTAMPNVPAADLVAKTKNVENLIWDFCIDTFQYNFISPHERLAQTVAKELTASPYHIEGHTIDHLPEGVLPIFDVVSCAQAKKLSKGVYAVNRITYSLLFCAETETRKKLLAYFGEKVRNGGITNLEDLVKGSLKGLVKEVPPEMLREKQIDPQQFQENIDMLYQHREADTYDNTKVIETMTSLLMDKRTRYDALRGYIQPLASLIDVKNYESRCGQGSGGGAPSSSDMSEVMQALLEGMTEQQAAQFLQQLAAGQGSRGNPHIPQLQLAAIDEYYKKHAPKISLESPEMEARTMDMGKIKKWVKDYSLRVTAHELHRHQQWIDFGLRQQLPVIAELSPGKLYVVTYFKQEEVNLESLEYRRKGIDVARNWVLIEDSSGTMGGGSPGCGSRWDMLQHIDYGILNALYTASTQTQQDVDVWVANFSTSTRLAGPLSIRPFYETAGGPDKAVLLVPENDNTTVDTTIFPRVQKQLKSGRTVWSFVTDGDITNAGDVYKHIQSLANKRDNCVLFFEISSHSSLGTQVQALGKTKPNVRYQSVSTLSQILQSSLNVLIQYEK